MNLLDFIYEFKANLEFLGDNEIDIHRFVIEYIGLNDIKSAAIYDLSTQDLRDLDLGLRAMSGVIKKHLGNDYPY